MGALAPTIGRKRTHFNHRIAPAQETSAGRVVTADRRSDNYWHASGLGQQALTKRPR